jgi:hypothetical protein
MARDLSDRSHTTQPSSSPWAGRVTTPGGHSPLKMNMLRLGRLQTEAYSKYPHYPYRIPW